MDEFQLEQRTDNEPLGVMILSEIAEQENIDPIEVSPKLYTAIDTDALEELFFGETDGPTRVDFTYAGHRVTIQGDDIVQITVE